MHIWAALMTVNAKRKQRRNSGSNPNSHREWLALIDIEGPFLSLPVLRRALPTLEAIDATMRQRLRQEHTSWQAAPSVQPSTWIDFVLRELLGWASDLHPITENEESAFAVDVSEHDVRISPHFALVEPGEDIKPSNTRLLVMECPVGQHPTARVAGDLWAASPADRLAIACRKYDVPLGLVSDGRWWTLLHSPREGATTRATFDAIGWDSAAERVLVRAFVSLLERRRFFAVPLDETLPALIAASEEFGEDLTDALGTQVRQAVELLVAAIGRADTLAVQYGEQSLTDVSAGTVYRGAVSVLMRMIFVLYAEERAMFPADNEFYSSSYALGSLCSDLEDSALRYGEDELEHSYAAWHRVLALFEIIYWGVDHPRLTMYPHDGSLFDSDNYSWLPKNIDDRSVLHILRSIQYIQVGGSHDGARRRLSYRELDVEKIGYVYEGLLSYDGYRAETPYICLIGKAGVEAEVPLSELEEVAAHCGDPESLATELAQRYKKNGIGSKRALQFKLDPRAVRDAEASLLRATSGDTRLTARLLPFAGIIRQDLRGQLMVVRPGELFVTASPLRKNSGTVYTPKELADEIVLHTLEPLVFDPGPLTTANRSQWKLKSAKQILDLKVADIAMGSGAFLVSAARYLGDWLVEAWARASDTRAVVANLGRVLGSDDNDAVVIQARRAVIENCLYGVDINETAVEVAKISLWLVSLDPNLPFTFLDDRLRTGDSLLGITSTEQLRWMHVNPNRGQELHNDLFQWTASIEALLEKVAEQRRRIPEIVIDKANPLGSLAEKRKLLREIRDDTAELHLLANLLTGALLQNCVLGTAGLDKAALQAAFWANQVRREGTVASAHERTICWLESSTDYPFPRQPLHWPLEFAEVFADGGFDAILGNNPYLGGQKIVGVLGNDYREYLVNAIAGSVRGSADLIAYFALRINSLLKETGQAGIVATNTLGQGKTRKTGLDQVVASGTKVRRATTSRPWPNRSSNLEYRAVWITRQQLNVDALVALDCLPVSGITSSLEADLGTSSRAGRLAVNRGISFQGSTILGLGFTMEPSRARQLIAKDQRNDEVLFPYLNGQDINSSPTASANRWAINFHDWSENQAKEFPDCYRQVLRNVKPEREKNNRKVYRDYWWQYAEKRPAMRVAIAGLSRVVVFARISRTAMPVLVSTGQIFNEKTVVFATESEAMLAILSSAAHYRWAVARCATLKTDLQYAPSDAFETFPLPSLTDELWATGVRLDTFRRDVMLSRDSGLTKTYNLVFNPNCVDEDIEELRRIHRAIDEATIRAYGWQERIERVGGLDHGFHHVGRETRYTIGPAAQREILDSLLELNHQRHAEEVAKGLHPPKKRR